MRSPRRFGGGERLAEGRQAGRRARRMEMPGQGARKRRDGQPGRATVTKPGVWGGKAMQIKHSKKQGPSQNMGTWH